MKVILRQSRKDRHVKDYFPVGQVIIPDSIEFDKGLSNPIEQPSETDCTAISGTDVATDQSGTLYSIDDLWALTPHSVNGADPRDSMKAITQHGLQPLNGGPRDTRWTSYLRSEGDVGDFARNLMASMMATQSSTTVASNYYQEWTDTPENEVLPMGKTRVSGHDYKISGWRTRGLAIEFHVKFWTGGFKWMPADIFNIELNKYGTGCYLPTTKETTANQISFVQKCVDAIINLMIKLHLL